MRYQRGQSMVEFAVGAAVLSLLMLGTVTLSGYAEVQRRALFSARKSAYEAMWYSGRVQADRSRQHGAEFADPGAADPVSGRAYVAERDLALGTTWGAPDGPVATAAQSMRAPLQMAGGFAGAGFDLQDGGLLRAQVDARIAPLAGLLAPFSSIDLTFSEGFTVLADAWQASGPDHVLGRVNGLVPGSRLAALSGLWSALLAPVSLLDPSLRQLCLGLVEPERIPEDRLGPGVTPAVGACP